MHKDGWTYEQEYVRCGKAACKSCPHGPYWYRYRREGPKVKKEYVGRVTFDERWKEACGPAKTWDFYDEMLSPTGDKLAAALAVLGLGASYSRERAQMAYKQASLSHHPDRGGDGRKMAATNAAWSYLRARHKW
jgi:hypothetical protein